MSMKKAAAVISGGWLVAATCFAFACGNSSSSGSTAPTNTGPGSTNDGEAPPSDDGGSSTNDGGESSDASDTDSAAVDSGRDFSTDRTKFFGASRCASSGLLLCEDFESGSLDKTTWTVVGNTPVIDGIQAARGTKALHITRTGNGASYIKEMKTFPAKDNTYWGRTFVYFNEIPRPDASAGFTYAHWTFVAASGTGTVGEIRLSAQLQAPGNIFGVGTDSTATDAGTGDWTTSDNDPAGAPKPAPTGQWLCIEWLHSGKTNETRFFWDATEHPSLYTSATKHGGNAAAQYIMPEFTNVWVGFQEYQPNSEDYEMWVDEIAIDSSRIGCIF